MSGQAHYLAPTVIVLAILAGSGCRLIKPFAMKAVAGALTAPGSAVTSHNDPETVEGALDFALVTNENILASIPRHEPLLTTTCSQYTQYGFGFIYPRAEEAQFEDYAKSKPLMERAFRLADRGRGYCWRALEVKLGEQIDTRLKKEPDQALRKAKRDHVPLLYWSAASLGASITLGGIERADLVMSWPLVRSLAERALALDESWGRGALHELMITVESQGEALGGSEERARKHFDRAIAVQHGLSPAPYVSLAMGVVKNKQDRAEFEKLLRQAVAIDPENDPTNRLITILSRRRAQVLLDHIDDLIPKTADNRTSREPRRSR